MLVVGIINVNVRQQYDEIFVGTSFIDNVVIGPLGVPDK